MSKVGNFACGGESVYHFHGRFRLQLEVFIFGYTYKARYRPRSRRDGVGNVSFEIRPRAVQHEEHVVLGIKFFHGNTDFSPVAVRTALFYLIAAGHKHRAAVLPVGTPVRYKILPCARVVLDIEHHVINAFGIERTVRFERRSARSGVRLFYL